MKVDIETDISKDHGEDIKVKIEASEYTKELGCIIEMLQNFTVEIDTILGRRDNEISIINIKDVINFYSEESKTYCKTSKGVFSVKQKLYELEEILPQKDFIRISNSTIVNIKYVDCFDVGVVGDIIIKFKDGSKEYVSKRKISNVMKFLKDRR